MSMFNERPPIPREMVHKIKPDGSLGDIISRETVVREGIVREMEVDVLMSVEVARSIKSWLENQIKKIDNKEINKSSNE